MLSGILGQNRAKKILQNALCNNRVAHAYLFHGPPGIGKKTLARAFARALLCPAAVDDSCGNCSICRRIAGEQFPDFVILQPAGNYIKIEQIRELQKKAQYKPYESLRKVYLINQAESMTVEAANCMLKILEDPPANTVFLLTAANPYNLLPTIISRCQLVPLEKVAPADIGEMLQERYRITPEMSLLLASLSEGLPGMAVDMAVSDKALETREMMLRLVDNINSGRVDELLQAAEELDKKKEILPVILDQLLLWFRDRLVWVQTGEESLIHNIDKLDRLKDESAPNNQDSLVRGIAQILETRNQIGRNINQRLAVEVLLLKLAALPRLKGRSTRRLFR